MVPVSRENDVDEHRGHVAELAAVLGRHGHDHEGGEHPADGSSVEDVLTGPRPAARPTPMSSDPPRHVDRRCTKG